jgi:hypothetical protein
VRGRLWVAEIEASYGNPCLDVAIFGQVGEVFHQGYIIWVRRNKAECVWVNEAEGKKQMGVSLCVELFWRHAVTLSGSYVPRLIVADGSSFRASTSLGTRRFASDSTRAVSCLAGQSAMQRIRIVAIVLRCYTGCQLGCRVA